VGVFQIESRAQMSMLPRLRPREFYDLVIEVGIVRPGPITGDMVHPYLRRRDGTEPVTYPHPSLEPVLKKTLGIPLFQEQVMKLAVVAADYTPGEADQLRRDMAAWRSRGKLEKHRQKLISRMVRKGIEEEFAERVYAQIQGFGEYGFPESHSASFALITYATSFMKHHYPVEFACSLLNSQPMGFYTPATIVDEAKREGVVFQPVSVEASDWDCVLEEWEAPVANPRASDWAIRMGLRYVKGLREEEALRVVSERSCKPFDSIRDFIVRTKLSNRSLEKLAQAGALDCFGMSRRHALWAVQEFAQGTLPLPFEAEPDDVGENLADLTPFETISWDYQTSFHSARGHPMHTIRDDLDELGLPDAETVRALPDGSHVSYAGMVICRQRPGTAKGVIFMTMEDETGFVNVIVWPDVFQQFRILTKTRTFLGVSGKLQNQHNVQHVVAEKLWIPRLDVSPPKRRSRDFH
jgi:error-prone DNA polymerase